MSMRFRFLSSRLDNCTSHSFLPRSSFSTELGQLNLVNTDPVIPSQHQIYTLLLRVCLQQCRKLNGHNLFEGMPHRMAQVSKTGKVIHSQSLKYGFSSEGLLGNAIVDLYAKCGDVCFAEKAFNTLQKKDALSWNSIMSMYSSHGSLLQVLKSFVLLRDCMVLPNEFSFAIVLSSCARLVNSNFGRQVHGIAIKMGLECSSFCEGALIDMYSKCHILNDARRVFDQAAVPDTVSWTSMIAGYVQVGSPEEALKVFEKMQSLGHEADMVAFVTVINACVSQGRLDNACELFDKMANPNVVAWNVMISGHAKRGYEMKAVNFFQSMRRTGIKPSRSTLGSVLSTIGSLAASDLGLAVHAEAMKLGLASNVYVGSSLISMYAKCKNMEAAKKVFDALDEKNVVIWNALLGGYSQSGYNTEVVKLFADMQHSSFDPDDFTYTSILSACACLQDLEMGCQLHTFIIKNKFASNLFVGNALVDMYAKSGALREARQQFEKMNNRDNVSWNAIIVGYVQEENEVEAFNLFRRMNLHGVHPDEACLASILSACANVQGFNQGRQVHCLSVKLGLETSVYAGSSLIDMYAKCGEIDEAHEVLSCMPARSVVSMNALIAGYSQSDLKEAILLFQEMCAGGLSPSEVTFASLLDACNEPDVLILGRQIHSLIVKRGLLQGDEFLGISLMGMYMSSLKMIEARTLFSEYSCPNSTVLWTALISGHSQKDLNEEALHFYREMHSNSSLPDQATFVSVLKACAILSSPREGRMIHSLIFHTGYDRDEVTCSALLDMYAKCGDVKGSVQVFEEMGCKSNVISWNSMIVGFAKNGYAEDALKIFNEMRQTHVTPDEVTFLGVLTACSHSGRVSEGRQIFELIAHPRVDQCACMVDLLGRWGHLEEAEEFIHKHKLESDAMVWASLLGACRIHGDDIRGQLAAERLIALEPQNSSSYVLLSNIYAASGDWDKVNSLRRTMRGEGVKKLPGSSWIVVQGKTNVFVAGHPTDPQMDAFLNHLAHLMKDIYDPHIDSSFQG